MIEKEKKNDHAGVRYIYITNLSQDFCNRGYINIVKKI